ncbi:histidine kinase [Paenibacillus sp. MWE-103]|uniref:Histidine kinase n=1 Tax=Paenibacillus artemisiicola TaxID=1172618 RepID=A0ABS3WBK4_9BACL|nr:histidine kinase [Paenibacillus artemisiicola]MBO7745677.1 histidine kinase [Paenibacillus artemisiicola]
MAGYRRQTPEELLLSISKIHRGRLKIYVGAVSGSGKTYHMLREGQTLKQQGIDVAVCAVSTMRRPETVEQLADLERIPSIRWMKGDVEKKDLNLDAILERNPEVLLVDSLAHENRPGAKFPTRREDIRFLLSRGISVITTVNVYELEGVKEQAQKLTGIAPECTVPSDLLEIADEVRLIDVSPETILNRLSEGRLNNVKDPELLKRGNVGKLRELALRLMAEGVNESLEKYREEQGFIGPSGASERILVAAQYHINGSIYIRRGQQIAKRLGGDLQVVVFTDASQEPTKEREAFKKSILKLVEKVGAGFREITITSRKQVPRALIRYAMLINATRIVMGHSKQTRTEELRQGSIARSLLKHVRNIDVFFMADRAEHEGERVLPTKRAVPKPPSEPYRRLSEQEVEKKIERIRRGRFKVYIGAAPGAGKTYMMLREGNDLLRKDIDVVIGFAETHGRPDTEAQIGKLAAMPRLKVEANGSQAEEMDVAAILARNPEVVLIDNLAHRNAPGSRNMHRYDDIRELLDAGISVIATLNVQHLESLKDSIEKICGTTVTETVPDQVLRLADEMELIDVAPSALQERLKEGRIYGPDKIEEKLAGAFKTGNLIALRELALREIADDVDERLEAWERNGSLRGPWRRHESIFVAVTTSPNAERLIRRGFRIAHRLKAEWHVHYVRTEGDRSETCTKRIEEMKALVDRLGGRFETQSGVSGNHVADALLAKANELKSTQIILGQSRPGFWQRMTRTPVIDTILREGRHMDVLVVADFNPNMALGEEDE